MNEHQHEQQHSERGEKSIPRNVGQAERVISTMIGALLLRSALSPRRSGGLISLLLGAALVHRGTTGRCRAYHALGVDTSHPGCDPGVPDGVGMKVERTVTVARPAAELYEFWRHLENLPLVMQHLVQVEQADGNRSRWTARGPLGKELRWEAETIVNKEGELIAWQSLPGGDVQSAGSVRFRELGHDRGTAVTVLLKYNPPAGRLGMAVARLLGQGLEQQLEEDLRAFKSIMESGEAPTVEGQPTAGSGERMPVASAVMGRPIS